MSRRQQLIIGALTLLAFALRLQRLDFQPLWGDEGWSIYFATLDLPHLLEKTAQDIHPAFYYVLLKLWIALLGSTPVAVRLLSVFVGTLAVPLIFQVGRRLFGYLPGMMAALVLTLAPFHVYYSQEVRMYGLVTLLGLASTYLAIRLLEEAKTGAITLWAAYVCLVTLAAYTQYYAVFIPLAHTIFVVAEWLRGRNRYSTPFILRWLAAQAAWLILFAPWLLYAGYQLQSYVAGKVSIEGYTSLGLPTFLDHYLGAFALGHLAPALTPLYRASGLFMVLALIGTFGPGCAAAWNRLSARSLALCYLLTPLLAAWLINLRFPFAPIYVERILLLAAPPYFLLIGLGLATLWRLLRPLALPVICALLALFIVSLAGFYLTPRYPEKDYRPLAARIAALGRSQDAIICSYQWQVGYFKSYLREPRPRIYVAPGWGEEWAASPERMARDLEALLAGHNRLWFPAFQSLGHLWEDSAERYLAAHAYPVLDEWYGEDTKLTFYAAGKTAPADGVPVAFGSNLLLTGYQAGTGPFESGWGVVPIDLHWQKQADLEGTYQVNLRLTGGAGYTWAARDSEPLRPFAHWSLGEEVDDRHGLLIPAGTPPGRYALRLRLYRLGDGHILEARSPASAPDFILGEIEVVSAQYPPPPAALPIQHRRTVDLAQLQLRFLGYSLPEEAYEPGQAVPLTLFWQALADGQQNHQVLLQLYDGKSRDLKTEALSDLAYSLRQSGELLRDPHELLLPADLADGSYTVKVTLPPADGAPTLTLGEIAVVGRPHNYDRPEVRYPLTARFGEGIALIGYDLQEQEIEAGGTLHLTLFWQALAPVDRSYTVFVHLLDAGEQIQGQRDQLPGSQGGRATPAPTSGWLPGEYLLDSYEIPVKPEAPPGRHLLAVGLYDADSGQRLPVFGQSNRPLGDRLLLEETPIIVRTRPVSAGKDCRRAIFAQHPPGPWPIGTHLANKTNAASAWQLSTIVLVASLSKVEYN